MSSLPSLIINYLKINKYFIRYNLANLIDRGYSVIRVVFQTVSKGNLDS